MYCTYIDLFYYVILCILYVICYICKFRRLVGKGYGYEYEYE